MLHSHTHKTPSQRRISPQLPQSLALSGTGLKKQCHWCKLFKLHRFNNRAYKHRWGLYRSHGAHGRGRNCRGRVWLNSNPSRRMSSGRNWTFSRLRVSMMVQKDPSIQTVPTPKGKTKRAGLETIVAMPKRIKVQSWIDVEN
ncbi:unnamed protein product, partial [Coregonus sp. 'balchen']